MTLFPEMPSRLYVMCPVCHSPHALVTIERTSTQSCFCPGCQHLWQTPLTRERRPESDDEGQVS